MNLKKKVLRKIKNLKKFPYITKDPSELEFFIEYTGSNGYLLILNPNEFYFYTDGRYYESYKNHYPENISIISKKKDLYNSIKQNLKETETTHLYVNPDFFTYSEFLSIRKGLKPIRLKKFDHSIINLRRYKNSDNITKVKKAIQITEEGLAYIISFLKAGMREREVAVELEYYLKLKGADEVSFPPIVLFGENTAYPHGEPGNIRLKEKDVILIDLGVKLDHFCSDITRTLVFREPPEDFSDDYHFLLNIQKKVILSIRPGLKASHLDSEIREKLKEKKKDKFYPHSLGHGVGTEVHESPVISFSKTNITLKKGDLFTIEPGIYIPGKYGIRIEDMVYINHWGKVEVLTTFPKELLIR